jgi:hypothetical protein
MAAEAMEAESGMKPPAAVNQLVATREENDCAIVALSAYLGVSYEDVLRAVTMTDRQQGKHGLWTRTLIRIAARLGFQLRLRAVDLEQGYGILRLPDHAVVLRNGLVFDGPSVWDADEYLSARSFMVSDCDFLEAVTDA